MNYNHTSRNDRAITVMVVCCVVSVLFSFCWLYCFQGDVMYVAQHALSDGKTQYSHLWGAVVTVLTLWLLQCGVFALTRLRQRAHALTWFPSMFALAVLTSVNADIDQRFTIGPWWWLAPLLLLLWGACVMVARPLQSYGSLSGGGVFSRSVWTNLLALVLMMCMVAVSANTNAVFHYRTHAEVALLRGDYEEALRVGERSLETDSCLMMIRMYALSRQHQLGECLFEYPMVASSDAMLPTTPSVRLQVYPTDSVYRHLGAIPHHAMQPMDYLDAIIRHGQAKPAAADYQLCGYLLDRRLDDFASALGRFYQLSDSLPRHYREALVLYTHKRSKPVVVYHDAVLDVDYADYLELASQYKQASERRGKIMERYANSYWYYFDYVGR